MTEYEKTEQAYKSGYAKGVEDGKPKWIPVMEQLPDKECIAIGNQGEMLIGWVYADAYSDTLHSAESDGCILNNVTHWMLLPEAPKEG